MAGGVNVKMGVSGIAQFKQNINQAKQSVKTLDAQLALTEKQFKNSGDAESYMTEKAALLQAKLEQQKSVLSTTEQALEEMSARGVDRASKAYQDMYRQMLQAKGDMLDTQNAMDGITESGAEAAESVENMNTELANVGKQVSVQNVVDGLDKITGGMEKAAKKAVDLGKKIMTQVLGVGTWADDINTRSAVLGVSPEDLQRMEKTAALIDTDATTIIKARQKLMRGVGNGTKGTMDALSALGIQYTGDAEDAFWKAGEAIMALGDEAKQEAMANDLFGKSWHDLIPLFSAGREEYEKMNGSWNVMSKDQLDQLNAMDDEYQKLQIAVEDLKREALSNLAEPMKEALTAVNELLGKIGDWLKSDEGKATVENVVTAITDAMKWVVDNKEVVIGALGAIVAGWGALKLTGGALKIYQLITGLQGLRMAGGAGASAAGASGAVGAAGGGGIGTGMTGFMAANGLSAFAPAAVISAAIAPALIAQAADQRRWAEEQQKRLETAGKLTGGDASFMKGSAAVMDQMYQWTDDPFKLLMGLQNRGDVQKARLFSMLNGQTSMGNYATNELLDLWKTGGEGWDQARLTSLLTVISDSYARMTENTAEVTGAVDEQKKTGDAINQSAESIEKAVNGLPKSITGAMNGVRVYMDKDVVGRIVSEYIAETIQ